MENKDINAINDTNDTNKNFNQYATEFDFNKSLTLLNNFEAQNSIDLTNREKASPISINASELCTQNVSSTLNSQEVYSLAAPSANGQEAATPTNEQETAQASTPTSSLSLSSKPALTSNSIVNEQLNKVESFLKSKVNSLNNKQRKLLGYSMMGVGIILATLLIVNTFTKLDFSDLLISSGSKEALTNLVTKAVNVASPSANTNNNLSDSSSNANANANKSKDAKDANSSNSNTVVSGDVLANWQPITSLLASTEKRRKKAAKGLGIDKGEWILACVSVGCWDCDRAALTLNQLKINNKVNNVLAITTANQTEASLWKERLGLEFEVKSVSSEAFDDTGAVFLPTIIKVKNAISIGAKESLEGK